MTSSTVAARRASDIGRLLGECCRRALTGPHREREAVLRRRERAAPADIVRARWIVGEIEVQNEAAVLHPEIRALHRVEEVAAAPVRRGAARIVAKRQKQTSAVAL